MPIPVLRAMHSRASRASRLRLLHRNEELAKVLQQFVSGIRNVDNLADETIRPEDNDGSALWVDWTGKKACQPRIRSSLRLQIGPPPYAWCASSVASYRVAPKLATFPSAS